MSEQTAQEPTMEEILASIRRIISEDEAPGEAKAEAPQALHAVEPEAAHDEFEAMPAEEEDVLELDQPYEAAHEEPESHAASHFDATPDIEPAPLSEPEPAGFGIFDAPPAEPVPAGRGLVDDHAASVVTSAFSSLTMNLAMPREGRTLEDLVREMMYPILKDWLNQNLPGIVEAQVRAEVDRLSRLRGAR